MAERPTLFYDLGSPYAYLAVSRAGAALGVEPRLEPVLLGAIFSLRGHGSWSQTAARAENVAEVEARAARYGLPPLRWPPGWPPNTLAAMRACAWAGEQFARLAFRRAFADGDDLADRAVLARIAEEAHRDPVALLAAIETPEVKDRLKAATAAAWERGVTGVPTVLADGRLFHGDDRLEDAAQALARAARRIPAD
jgi:2-hydroxychromene-2-carboxylate isomerase